MIPTSTSVRILQHKNMLNWLAANPQLPGMPDSSFHAAANYGTSYQLAVFPQSYNMGLLKVRVNKFLKSQQHIRSSSGAANGHNDCLTLSDLLMCLLHMSKSQCLKKIPALKFSELTVLAMLIIRSVAEQDDIESEDEKGERMSAQRERRRRKRRGAAGGAADGASALTRTQRLALKKQQQRSKAAEVTRTLFLNVT